MLRLRTLGSVYVMDGKGTPLGGAASQRRPLALLSLLATAGEAGVSRDRILGLLWPDGEPERSRHALTQTLYHIRRALRCDELFFATADVRLDFSRISCDVCDLQQAVAGRDPETVAQLYTGPFLDGFYLAGSAEFEQWTSSTRAQLSARVSDALEQLARRAEDQHDLERAMAWRKRLCMIDPLSSTSTKKLIATMASAGDRAGALQHARSYQQMLREELDVEPDASLLALIERLRIEPEKVSYPSPASSGERQLPAAEAPQPEPVPTLDGERARDRMRRGWRWGPAPRWVKRGGVAAALVLSGFVLSFGIAPRSRLTATVPTPRQPILIAPFRVAGADPALSYLRAGLVELLSVRLAEDGPAQALDAGTALSAWRSAPDADERTLIPRHHAIAVARRLGAAQVVLGSVVGTPSRLVVSASLIAVASDSARAQVSMEGPSDSLTSLVDRVASKLIAASAGEADRFTDQTTPSPPSLRAYLEGQAEYRRGDYAGAVPLYERALSLDSGFALAAFHLALAADQMNDAEQHDRALALAWANRADLNDRDRVHLVAFAGERYPAPSSESEQLMAWERALARSPDRAEVWHELGERFFHQGAVLGLSDARERATSAFRHALELDPSYLPSRRLLLLLAARWHDSTLLARMASPRALRDSMGDLAPALRWRAAIARGDQQELRRIREHFGEMDDASLRIMGMTSQFDAEGIPDGERALRIRERRGSAVDRVDALLALHSLALNQGRPVLALDLTEQLQELRPGLRAHLRLRVLDALYGDGDPGAAREAATLLAQHADAPPFSNPDSRALQLADLCVLEQWRLSRGVTKGTRHVVATLREAPPPRTVLPVAANQLACAEILDATWSVLTRQMGALERVARLDSLMLGGPAVSDAGTYAHIQVAWLYDRLGQRARALAAIRRRSYLTGWPRYLATARREEGRLATLTGDIAGAMRSYSRYLALRDSAEPAARFADERIRAAVARNPAASSSSP